MGTSGLFTNIKSRIWLAVIPALLVAGQAVAQDPPPDLVPPSSNAVQPSYAATSLLQIELAYQADADAEEVELHVTKTGDPTFSDVETDESPETPNFTYEPASDGEFNFHTVAIDAAGNREPAPPRPDATVEVDRTAPTTSATSPAYHSDRTQQIEVDFSAADEGVGLEGVELWARLPGSTTYAKYSSELTWNAAGLGRIPVGSAPLADGTYSFYTVGSDSLGNDEAPPQGADAATIVDTVAPSSAPAPPAATNAASISIPYTASDPAPLGDVASGVAEVELWAKVPGATGPVIVDTDTDSPTAGAGTFQFIAAREGDYEFFTRAKDSAGNYAGAGAVSTTRYETAKPASAASAGPALANSRTITISHGAQDPVPPTAAPPSGVDHVELWVKGPGAPGYTKWPETAGPSEDFSFVATADGSHSFYTRARDRAGNYEDAPANPDQTVPADDSVMIDTVFPTTSDDVGTNVWHNAAYRVTLAASEPGTTLYAVYTDGTAPPAPTTTYSAGSKPQIGHGQRIVYSTTDSAGNAETAHSSPVAQIDTAPPAFTTDFTAPSGWQKNPVPVTLAAQDGESGLQAIRYEIGSPPATPNTTTSPTYNSSSPPTLAHNQRISYLAVDAVGNQTAITTSTPAVQVDGNAPVTTVTSPASFACCAQGPVAVDLNPTDSPSAVKETWFTTDGTDPRTSVTRTLYNDAAQNAQLDDGETLSYYSIDNAGNQEQVRQAGPANVDVTPPTSSATVPPGSNGTDVKVRVTATDARSTISKVELYEKGPRDSAFAEVAEDTTAADGFEFTRTTAIDGRYAYYSIAHDQSGRQETKGAADEHGTVIVERHAPEASADELPAETKDPVIEIEYSASDAPFPTDDEASPLFVPASGLDEVKLWVKRPGEDAFQETGSDDSPEPDGAFAYDVRDSGGSDGTYEFAVQAIDRGGNAEPVPDEAETETLLDRAAPVTTDDVPAGYVNDVVTVTLDADDPSPSSGGVQTWYTTDGSDPKVTSNTGREQYDASQKPGLADGQKVRYYSVDELGNEEEGKESTAVQVDQRDPCSAIGTTLAPNRNTTSVHLEYTFEDIGDANSPGDCDLAPGGSGGSGVQAVELWVKRNSAAATLVATDTDPSTPEFDYTIAAGQGRYQFWTRAVDGAGNTEQAPPDGQPDAQTLYETVAPDVTANVPSEWQSQPVVVELVVTDPNVEAGVPGSGTDPAETYFTTGPDPADPADPASGRQAYSATNQPRLGDGDKVRWVVKDNAGNTRAGTSSAAKVDQALPSSSASAPGAVNTDEIPVSFSASDTGGSGVDKVELWVKEPTDTEFEVTSHESTSSSGTFIYEVTNPADGAYEFATVATDHAGNREVTGAPTAADATTTVDIGAPFSRALSPQMTSANTFNVTYEVTDPNGVPIPGGSDVERVDLWVRKPGDVVYVKTAVSDTTPGTPQIQYTAPPDLDGEYAFYTVATDTAGNEEDRQATDPPDLETLVDRNTPQATAQPLPVFDNEATINVGYEVTDGGAADRSDLDRVELFAKRSDQSSFALVGRDDTDPDLSGTLSYTPSSSSGDGTYQFYVRARDAAGNQQTAAAAPQTSTTLDRVRPTTTDDVPAELQGSVLTVSLEGTDDRSGIAKTWYTTDGSDPSLPANPAREEYSEASKPQLSDGERARYYSVDRAGNPEAEVRTSQPAHVDVLPPVTTDDVSGDYGTEDVTVTLTAQDRGGSTVAATWYTTGTAAELPDPRDPASGRQQYDASEKPVLEHGERIRYSSVDGFGHYEDPVTSAAAQVDKLAPETVASEVPAGWVNEDVVVELTASDAGSGVDATFFRVHRDGDTAGAFRTYDGPVSLDDGESLEYYSTDTAGNEEAPQRTSAARVDKAPPTTSASEVPESAEEDVAVTVTPADEGGSGIDRTYYRVCTDCTVEGGEFTEVEGDEPFEVALGDGEALQYYSTDAAGNQQAKQTTSAASVTTPPPVDPDTDGDGVNDSADACPAQPAQTPDGCPPSSSGGDGGDGGDDQQQPPPVDGGTGQAPSGGDAPQDPRDEPQPPADPDSDGDGLADSVDLCPAEAATTADGCPVRERPADPDEAAPAIRLAVAGGQTLPGVIAHGLRVNVRTSEAATVGAQLLVSRATARRLGISRAVGQVVGRDVKAGGHTTLRLALTRPARKALRKLRSVNLQLLVTGQDEAQNVAQLKRTVRLAKPARRGSRRR